MLTLLALLAVAQPETTSTAETSPVAETVAESGARPVRASLRLWGDATAEADFDGDNGSVQSSRAGADFEVGIPIGERSQLAIAAGTTGLFFDFGGDEGFGAGDPWDTVLEHTLGVGFSTRANEKWSYGGRAFVRSSGERGADFSDTMMFGVGGGFEYTFSEKFSAGPGFLVMSQLEDDVLVLPLVTFSWKISERWSAGTRVGTGSGLGAGGGVQYQATDSLAVFGGVGYQSHRFRLDEDGATPDGVGEVTGVPVTLGFTWTASPQVSLSARGGWMFAQEYTLDDEDGDELREIDADSAPFLGATLHFSF